MVTISPTRAYQLEIDLEIDRARIARNDMQLALDHDLHAVTDYVHPDTLIVWRPGEIQAKKYARERSHDVQLTTTSSCTCTSWKLRDHCEHVEFVRALDHAGIVPGMNEPVAVAALSDEVAA